MNREEVTDLIVMQKIKKKLTWAKLAEIVGHSKEWSTAALLGQMTLTEAQAQAIGTALDLPEGWTAFRQGRTTLAIEKQMDQRLPLRFTGVEPVGDDLRILARVQGRDHFLHA